MSKQLSKTSYQKLLNQIRKALQSGTIQVQKAFEQERVQTYWNVGRLIYTAMLDKAFSRNYGLHLYENIGEDINYKPDLLSRMVQFYKNYPTRPTNSNLKWTHYLSLIRIADSKIRKQMEKRIEKENITSFNLKRIVSDMNSSKTIKFAANSSELKVNRRLPYFYRISMIKNIHSQKFEAEIDLGFGINIDKPVDSNLKFQRGQLIRSSKEEGLYTLTVSSASRDNLYTYVAYIERIVDGDTIIAKIDCGFGVKIRQRLRLKGIDAFELKKIKGEKAKRFVYDQLKDNPYIIIKTYGSDKYDRYLVDVFYLPDETDPLVIASEGKYLNQELLDDGFAVIWEA